MMKRLIVSIKSTTDALDGFQKAFRAAKTGRRIEPHYEISFDNKRDFDRFVRNIYILSNILAFKPKSVYELAKVSSLDVSNLNRIILFFEEIGAVKVKEHKVGGRTVKTPVVDYDKIEFDLKAA
jgi:predicted transcriptional regulator